MRFFYEPSTSDTESEASVVSYRSSKSKGKQRAIEVEQQPKTTREKGKGKQKERPVFTSRNRLASASPSTSSSSSKSDSDEDDEEDDESAILSESDSEEEAFPVNPGQAEARRRLNKYAAHHDPLEVYHNKEQQRAWERAQASHNRDLVALRTIRLNAFAKAEQDRQKSAEDDLEQVRLVLEDFDFRRQKEEERVDREFTQRNTARWDEINRAISQLEKEASAAEQAKKRQQEAEEKAKALREAELAKIEKEKQEQERKRTEEEQSRQRQEEDRKAAAAKAAEERERKAKEDAGKAAIGVPSTTGAPPSTPASSDSGKVLSDAKAQFERWHAKVQEIKNTVLPAVSGNPSLKNACWKLKRSLSTRISNVSASAADVQSTAQAIHASLTDAKSNPQAYLWCLNLLSKKVIEMAGNNSESDLSPVTYALAQVVVALLCADHAEFADIFMARLVKRCPYVIPYHPSRGQLPLADFNKLIGRKESEQSVNYKQRMSGIIALYAAVVQTSPTAVPTFLPSPTVQHIPSYLRSEGGWRWYATILRPPLPLLDTTALLLFVFLRMTGEQFHQVYGKQYIKLLQAIADQAIDQKAVKWNDGVQGDLSKARLLIGGWMETGRIKGADGRVPA